LNARVWVFQKREVVQSSCGLAHDQINTGAGESFPILLAKMLEGRTVAAGRYGHCAGWCWNEILQSQPAQRRNGNERCDNPDYTCAHPLRHALYQPISKTFQFRLELSRFMRSKQPRHFLRELDADSIVASHAQAAVVAEQN